MLHKEMESIFEGEDASQYASSSEHWQAGPKGPYRHTTGTRAVESQHRKLSLQHYVLSSNFKADHGDGGSLHM